MFFLPAPTTHEGPWGAELSLSCSLLYLSVENLAWHIIGLQLELLNEGGDEQTRLGRQIQAPCRVGSSFWWAFIQLRTSLPGRASELPSTDWIPVVGGIRRGI